MAAAFGTGAVKVTPGHDPNDYEMGQRHDLPTVSIMNDDATLNDEAGPYASLDRYAAPRGAAARPGSRAADTQRGYAHARGRHL